MKRMLPLLFLCLPALAGAAGMKIDVELPRLDVAEYHRPYVAAWIEREDSSAAANLSVWYQQERARARKQEGKPSKGGGESGSKWLPDLRQWWRRNGRSQAMPIDGVTGATRAPGMHKLVVDAGDARVRDLAPGNYRLVVEAVRETGGRELLKIAFAWPAASAQSLDAQGTSELGKITLTLTP